MQTLADEMARREYQRAGRGGSQPEAASNLESSVSTAQLTSFILDALSLPSPMATSCPQDSDDKMLRLQGDI